MIEHFCELAFVGASLSVAESEVAVEAETPCVMVTIIGTIECIFFDCSKVGLNDVKPRRIGRCPDRDDLVF